MACPDSMYTNDHISCKQCEGGKFLQMKGKRICLSCPIGYFRGSKSNKADECSRCAKGYFTKIEASIRCDECDRGRYWASKNDSDNNHFEDCYDCEAGKYQESRGSILCLDCPHGKMGETIAATKLDSCKKPNFTVAADCLPNDLGSRYLDDTHKDVFKHKCVMCPNGALCDYSTDGAVTASGVRTKAGFWRVPIKFYNQNNPHVQKRKLLESEGTNNRLEFVSCYFPNDCPEEPPKNDSNTSTMSYYKVCRSGTRGLLCADCEDGWIRKGGTCKKCQTGEVPRNIAVLFALLIMVLAFWYSLRRWLRTTKPKYRNTFKDVVMAVKIFVTFQQVNTALPLLVNNYPWPKSYLRFLDTMDFVNIDFLALIGLDCVVTVNYRYNIVVSFAIPCLIVVSSLIVYLWNRRNIRVPRHFTVDDTMSWYTSFFELVDADMTDSLDPQEFQLMFKEINHVTLSREDTGRLLKKLDAKYNAARGIVALPRAQYLLAVKKELIQHAFPPCSVKRYVDDQFMKSMFLSATVQLLLLVHAPASQKAFYYFATQRIGDKAFLRRDLSIEYGSRYWLEFLPIVLLLLIGFTLMLPIVLGTTLFCRRNDLHTVKTKRTLGFLYARFKKGAEGWDVHESFRRLILTGMLIYISPSLRAGVAVIVCTIAISSLHYYHPHKNIIVFRITQVAFFLTTMKYLITMFGAPGENSDFLDADQVGILFIIMDLTVGIGTIVCIFLMIGIVTGCIVRKSRRIVKVDVKGVGLNENKCVQVIPKARSRIHEQPLTGRATNENSKSSKSNKDFSDRSGVWNNIDSKKIIVHAKVSRVMEKAATARCNAVETVEKHSKEAHGRLQKRLQHRKTTTRSLHGVAISSSTSDKPC
jgi:hypothetical protein